MGITCKPLFQCDLCVFCNLKNCNPGVGDRLLLACIRQINLDTFWGRESATVHSTLHATKQTINLLSQVGVSPPYPPMGPYPVGDPFGYALAVAMLLKSREPGRYAPYQQHATIQKLHAGFSNLYQASLPTLEHWKVMGGGTRLSSASQTAPQTPCGLNTFPEVVSAAWDKL
jgi:hypothetical protein